EFLAHIMPEDPERRLAEQAMRTACVGQGPACALRLAEITSDLGERLSLLESAVASAQGTHDAALLARCRTALGDFYAGRRERNAQAQWRAALEAHPDFFPAALKLADLWADRGLGALAE